MRERRAVVESIYINVAQLLMGQIQHDGGMGLCAGVCVLADGAVAIAVRQHMNGIR